MSLAPDSAAAHDTLGLILLHHEDRRGAEREFRKALELDPEDEVAHNNLALTQLSQGRTSEAVAGLERAARLDPTDPKVQRNLRMVDRHAPRRLWRLVAALLVVYAALALAVGIDGRAPGAVGVGVLLLALAAAAEMVHRRQHFTLSPATRTMLRDQRRARRFRPREWDWSASTRLRPWWWVALERLPAPAAFVLNAGLVAALARTHSLLLFLLMIALPFSGLRAYRWVRRRRPAASSWRPPA